MSAPSVHSWPADDTGGTLGAGRFATATHHPGSVAELQGIVLESGGSDLAVYPQGGRTALDYGGIPSRPGVAVRLGRLDRVVDYPAADMTITVEAGITLGRVRALVAEQGQRLAIEAAWPDLATIGGIFATATTGPRRFGWGRPRDQIIGVTFVNGAGELVRGGGRVVKNVAGYDLPKLLTGSLGTLGIITEVTLKVNPRPEASALVSVDYDSLADAAGALDRLNISGTRPVALELVTSPPDLRRRWVLKIGFEGNRAAVDWQVARLISELDRSNSATYRDDEAEAEWLSFVAAEGQDPAPLAFVASFAPSRALAFLDQVDLNRWSVRVHAGNGVVRGMARGDHDFDHWAAAVGKLRAEASQLDGSLVLSCCPTAWKDRLQVWGPTRADWAIAERVKRALDPGLVLNPGRFVGTI